MLPLRAGLGVGTLAGHVGWRLAGATRRRMLDHLALAFPDRSSAEREALGRASFVHLSWLAAEMVTIRSYDRRLEEYVSFAPGAEERLRQALAPGRGLVMVTGHVGNWELMARRVVRAGIPFTTVVRTGNDAGVNLLLTRFRQSGGIELLFRESPSTARALLRCFKQGRLLALLIDQDTTVQGVFVPFFGRPAWTPRGAADLALRFQAPVVVVWSRRRGPHPGDGHEVCAEAVPYDAAATDREAESRALTARCTAVLERAIRGSPAEWVWMHERWRRRPEAEPQPA